MKPLIKIDYQRIGEKSLLTKPVYVDDKVKKYFNGKDYVNGENYPIKLHKDIHIGIAYVSDNSNGHYLMISSVYISINEENTITFLNVKEREDFVLGLNYINSEFISLPETEKAAGSFDAAMKLAADIEFDSFRGQADYSNFGSQTLEDEIKAIRKQFADSIEDRSKT
jgi:hypothetical protein